MKIVVMNGPNLGILGAREPGIYGTTSLATVNRRLTTVGTELGVELEFLQSNHEGVLLDRLNALLTTAPADGVIINPAAFTHTSVALYDALRAAGLPTLEVHLSNIAGREGFRHESLTAPACLGVITGLGADGYEWALRALVRYLNRPAV